jgi:hypothetical protein
MWERKTKRTTWSLLLCVSLICRGTWAGSERVNLYNWQIMILPRKTRRMQHSWAPGNRVPVICTGFPLSHPLVVTDYLQSPLWEKIPNHSSCKASWENKREWPFGKNVEESGCGLNRALHTFWRVRIIYGRAGQFQPTRRPHNSLARLTAALVYRYIKRVVNELTRRPLFTDYKLRYHYGWMTRQKAVLNCVLS